MDRTQVTMTTNMFEADCFTHSSTFHADEVMATAIIAEMSGKEEIRVYRTNRMDDVYPSPDSIVYDIGHGQYDHHQKGGNGYRENGVPYSSCGLIWRDFGMRICCTEGNPMLMWRLIDESLIQGIDAVDNGTMPKVDYPCSIMSLSGIISSFNTNWDEDSRFQDKRFLAAVELARKIFSNAVYSAKSKARAFDGVMRAVDKSSKGLMILDEFMPWQEFLFSCDTEERIDKAKGILYVVYPGNCGGYQWRVVPTAPGSFEQRNHVPKEWLGLRDAELQKVSGVATATFVHPNGFIGSAEEKSDCIDMALKAITLGSKA